MPSSSHGHAHLSPVRAGLLCCRSCILTERCIAPMQNCIASEESGRQTRRNRRSGRWESDRTGIQRGSAEHSWNSDPSTQQPPRAALGFFFLGSLSPYSSTAQQTGINPKAKHETGPAMRDNRGHLQPRLAFALKNKPCRRTSLHALHSCINS